MTADTEGDVGITKGKVCNKNIAFDAPEDRRNLVYAIFVWLGIGTLLPWNFFITVNSYWKYKYRSVNATYDAHVALLETQIQNETLDLSPNDMQISWVPQMAVASMVPNVTVLILNGIFGHRFRTQPRLLYSLILVIILFTFTAIMTIVNTDDWQFEFLILTLVTVVLINISAAIFQSGLIGIAGKFPPKYIGGVFSGQAVGGIFASVTNVLVIALGADPVYSAFFCFLTAVLFLGVALVFYIIVTRSVFFQYYLGEKVEQDKPQLIEENKESKAVQQDSRLLNTDSDSLQNINVVQPRSVEPLKVFNSIFLYAISVFLIFVVTLACFPALTVLVVSTTDPTKMWSKDFFIPVCCFVLFNVGDYVGRFAAETLQRPKPGVQGMWIVFVCSFLRFAFIPLFLICNANPTKRAFTDPYLVSDTFYIIIMALFSLSNGYLSNIAMMSAPGICKPNEQQTAASQMVAVLGLGLGCGSLLSNAVVMLL